MCIRGIGAMCLGRRVKHGVDLIKPLVSEYISRRPPPAPGEVVRASPRPEAEDSTSDGITTSDGPSDRATDNSAMDK